MHQSFECLTHEPLHHGCMKPSQLAREGEIEKTEACGIEMGRLMERSRQNVQGGEPNMATVHHLVPDGASDGASRATNHPLRAYVWIHELIVS